MKLTPEIIQQKLLEPLPGLNSHLKLAPTTRVKEITESHEKIIDAKKSAVMILLFHEGEELKVVLIRRSFYVGIHAGQIAFPGGRYEEEDGNVENTAKREIEEEIGITAEKIHILGRLTDIYVPPSNFLISIFVGYLSQKPVYKIDEREVAEVIEVNLNDFYKENIIHEKEFVVPSAKSSTRALYYEVGNIELWGASAMVMTELLDVITGNEKTRNETK